MVVVGTAGGGAVSFAKNLGEQLSVLLPPLSLSLYRSSAHLGHTRARLNSHSGFGTDSFGHVAAVLQLELLPNLRVTLSTLGVDTRSRLHAHTRGDELLMDVGWIAV